MSGSLRDRLRAQLADCKMPGALEAVDDILRRIDAGELTAGPAMEALLGSHIALRNQRRLQTAMRCARLPTVKTLDDFDFSFQPSVKRDQLESLHTLQFLERKENVVFLGPPGVGKTHLSVALGLEACRLGLRVMFTTAAALITTLGKALYENRLEERLKLLTQPKLLIIDEIGYIPIDRQGANLFFQLVSRRYERGAILLTSNQSLGAWGDVFGDAVIASAILDRLLHHATTINIKGDSYRLREKRKAGLVRSSVTAHPEL
jgi:DNA replication protein DnaC